MDEMAVFECASPAPRSGQVVMEGSRSAICMARVSSAVSRVSNRLESQTLQSDCRNAAQRGSLGDAHGRRVVGNPRIWWQRPMRQRSGG